MINDISQPLIFLGTNSNIFKIYELAESVGYKIAGIIDDDYHEQGLFRGISIISSENEIEKFRNTHQFFCATNWLPDKDAVTIRNKNKRIKYINMLDTLQLNVATIVSPLSQVSKYSKLGKGILVDNFSVIEPDIVVDNYVSIHPYSIIGHGSQLGRNSVIQRYCLITSNVMVENDVYFGLCSRVCRSNITISRGTFIHPSLMLLRSTAPEEEISLAGKDLRKVYQQIEVE